MTSAPSRFIYTINIIGLKLCVVVHSESITHLLFSSDHLRTLKIKQLKASHHSLKLINISLNELRL